MDAAPTVFLLVTGSCSVAGIAIAMIMYSLFSDGRDMTGNTILNFFGAVFMSQLFYVIGVGGGNYLQLDECCIALALAGQYLRITETVWIFLMARTMHHAMKKTIGLVISSGAETHVVQLNPPRKSRYSMDSQSEFPLINKVLDVETTVKEFVISLAVGWGLPLLILCFAVTVEFAFYEHKVGPLHDQQGHCWFMSDRWSLITAFLLPNFIFFVMTLKELIEASVMARRARHLLFSQKCTRIAFMYIFLSLKMQLLVTSVNFLGSVAVFTGNDIVWTIFHILSSVKGVLVSVSLACDCQLLASFDTAWRKSRRKSKKVEHDMLTGTTAVDSSEIELL